MNRFDPETHQYFIDDERVPSVTEILEGVGIIDKRWYTEKGRDRGSAVHVATQYLDEEDLDWSTVGPEIEPYVRAYELFKEETKFQPVLIETSVFNREHRYGGTLDRTGILDGEKVLIDIKTGAPSKWAALQTAGYEICLEERHARKVLQLKPNGKYKLRDYNNPEDTELFLAAARIAAWKQNGTNKAQHPPTRNLPDEMDPRSGGGREQLGESEGLLRVPGGQEEADSSGDYGPIRGLEPGERVEGAGA